MIEQSMYYSKLFWNQIFRILICSFILFGMNQPLFFKIFLIMIFDYTDNRVPFNVDINESFESFELYQQYDKIGDMTVYTLLWIYYLNYVNSPSILKIYISILFIYRMIGFIVYLINKNRNAFVYFPNFFLESLFVISLLQTLGYTYPKYFDLYVIALFLVILFKIYQEFSIHYKSPDYLLDKVL
jgi:hypothetical protein